MSDYLWDKTGEAEPEVERLENLLGAFAHRPRPLELPAAEPRPRRAPWWRYAVAAAVLLAVVAGALVALRPAGTDVPDSVVEAPPHTKEGPPESVTPAAPPQPEKAPAPEVTTAPRRGRELAERRRPAPRPPASAVSARRARPATAQGAREVASAEGQRAKEQLMYALRLTGVKLEEVRRKVRGEEDAEGSPEERGRTR